MPKKTKTTMEWIEGVFLLIQFSLLLKKNFGQKALTLFLANNMKKETAEIVELWFIKERQSIKEFKEQLEKDGIRKRKIKRL